MSGLVSDKYDFAANLDKTEERERAISFTDAVYMPHGVFVVLDNSAEHTATDIFAAELPIATSQGSAHEAKIVELGGKTLPIDTYPNAVQAVKAKRAVAEFTDLPTAEAQVQADPSLKIVVPDPLIYQATANYGVRKDTDQRSLEAVNAAIAETEAAMVDALADVGYMDIGELGAMQKVAK
ncbi:transporter substrate-binding domain-containing protein [Rhodococcus sp. USK10]|nr:transporter substrate-binding domain-containing protein [Rhodococcus sp. USK10]